MGYEQFADSPEIAWIKLARKKAEERDMVIYTPPRKGNECLKFGIREDSDSEYQAAGKVRCSLSEDRTCDLIWNEFSDEIEANHEGDDKIFSLILDIYNSDQRGFEPGIDHFLAIPADVLQKEVNGADELAIKIKGNGRYGYPFNNYVDDWGILFP